MIDYENLKHLLGWKHPKEKWEGLYMGEKDDIMADRGEKQESEHLNYYLIELICALINDAHELVARAEMTEKPRTGRFKLSKRKNNSTNSTKK